MLKIQKTDYVNELYHKYPGRQNCQPCYVELDLREGILYTDWNAEIGNAVPMDVYKSFALRWTIPCLTGYAADELLDNIFEWAKNIYDEGININLHGNNILSEDQLSLVAKIEQHIAENWHNYEHYEDDDDDMDDE